MKERVRRRNRSYKAPGTITWNYLPGVNGPEASTVTESVYGDVYAYQAQMRDFIKKDRQLLSKRVLNSDMDLTTWDWSDSTVSYHGPTIGGSVNAVYPHLYTGVDFSDTGFIPDHPLTFASKLYAETQPFRRGEYSMWVQAREMLELATLFQIKAASFLDLGANAYLNVKFGWLPFLNDMKTVGGLMEDHTKRVKELTALAERGWYSRKRVYLYGTSRTSESNVVIASHPWPVFITGVRKVRQKITYRGSCRWGLAPGAWRFFEELEAENSIFRTAMEKLVGFEQPSPQDVWNIIPFSWLVDYFVKINDFLGANFDDGLFEITEGSVTRTIDWHATITPDARVAPTGNATILTLRKHQKTRRCVDEDWRPRIRFSGADLLSYGQWGVLAALLVKFRPRGTGKPIDPR